MKKTILILFLLFFGFSGKVLASSAKSVVETQVEGDDVQVHQVVGTTVDGQTVRKESSQPGKLELKMEKAVEGEPTVLFTQEAQKEIAATPAPIPNQPPFSFFLPIIEFFQRLLSRLGLDNLF